MPGIPLGADGIVRALSSLDLLKDYVSSLAKAYANTLLVPCIKRFAKGSPSSFAVGEHSIELAERSGGGSLDLFSNLITAIQFPLQRLPRPLATMLGDDLIAATTSHLMSDYLPATIPADFSGIQAFRSTLEKVTEFNKALNITGISANQALVHWVKNAPQNWIAKRLESSLDSLRQLLKGGLGSPRAVERVETQEITSEDDVFAGRLEDEDWNAGWDEEAEDEPESSHDAPAPPTRHEHEGGDEDEDAWGFGEEEVKEEKPSGATINTREENDDGNAWGWGDDDDGPKDSKTSAQPKSRQATRTPRKNGQPRKSASQATGKRTVTLKEAYYITAVPEQILEIIIMVIEDAEALAKSKSGVISPFGFAIADSVIAAPGTQLRWLPQSCVPSQNHFLPYTEQ